MPAAMRTKTKSSTLSQSCEVLESGAHERSSGGILVRILPRVIVRQISVVIDNFYLGR